MIKFSPSLKQHSELDMTPLIDVIFILLLFFVLAASFTLRGLDVDLPRAQNTKAVSGRIIEIRLSADAKFWIDNVEVDKKDIPYVLTTTIRSFRSRPGQLVLFSDPNAPVESLIYLVDTVKKCGGAKLLVATNKEKE